MALTQDERDVLNGLQSWHDRIEELLALFDGQGEVDGSHRSRAEQLYRALKDDLRKAHEPMDTTAGAARLNAAERACYQPTITEAFVHLTPQTNSRPGPRWFSALSDAQADFSHMISQLLGQEQK